MRGMGDLSSEVGSWTLKNVRLAVTYLQFEFGSVFLPPLAVAAVLASPCYCVAVTSDVRSGCDTDDLPERQHAVSVLPSS